MEHGFTWWNYIPNSYLTHNLHVTGAITVFVIIAILVILARLNLKKKEKVGDVVIPDSKFSILNIFELYVEFITNLSVNTIGEEGKHFVPFVGSLFIFILFGNLLGLVPGFLPPTEI